MAESRRQRRKTAKPQAGALGRTPALEWIAAGFGALATLGVIGFLTVQGLRSGEAPPALAATAEAPRPAPGGWSVPIQVKNHSPTTAAEVEIEGTLAVAGAVQTRSITFDYVPGRGNRSGALSFSHDPRTGRMTLAVKGYVEP